MVSRFQKVTLGIAGALTVAIVVGVAGGYFWLRTSLPQTDGKIVLSGLNSPVEIIRDANAVPHIFAKNQEDAYFALGYVHAQDRLWQMEFMRRLGAGRLAEVLGKPAIESDRFIRTLGVYRVAEAIFEATSPDVRSVLEAYAAGVNIWLTNRSGALPPEFVLLGFEPEPWHPADSLVWNRLMALRLGRNWRIELLRARIARELERRELASERLAELWPGNSPGAPVTLASVTNGFGPVLDFMWNSAEASLPADSGSNGWIVHGRLTKSGKPVLANDPHLSFEAPVLWYLARIEAPGLTLLGVTVPGLPFTVLGHNGSIAWGFTNAGGDVEDLFVETVDPNDPRRYLTPLGSRLFESRQEVIRVKGAESIELTVRETRHGPVISDISKEAAGIAKDDQVIALATPTLRSDDRTTEALLAINRARDWADFSAAATKFHTPQQNLFFAATNGDIGFVSPGRIPVRKSGDGRAPVSGADGLYDWQGFIPTNELPRAYNPQSGRIINANNRIIGDDYPYLITHDWALPYRAERITEVLEGQASHGVADSEELHRDVLSTAARQLLPLMLRVEPKNARGRRAADLLSNWDFAMRRERSEPLIYTAWLRHLIVALAEDEIGASLVTGYQHLVNAPGPIFVEAVLTRDRHWCDDIGTSRKETCEDRLVGALDQALDEITASLGPDMSTWRWGALHQATFTHRILSKVPVIAWWANLSIGSDGGDNTVNRGKTIREMSEHPFNHTDGSGYRAVYDLSDLDNSRFMIATGQSGNFLSSHYDDLLSLWRDGEYIFIAGERNEVKRSANGSLLLQPAS